MGTTIMSYINNNDMEKGTVNIMDYDGTHLLLCIYWHLDDNNKHYLGCKSCDFDVYVFIIYEGSL